MNTMSTGNGREHLTRPEVIELKPDLHPSWRSLMRYCAELKHGEIERLKIQDGLPVLAEVTTKKVKFAP